MLFYDHGWNEFFLTPNIQQNQPKTIKRKKQLYHYVVIFTSFLPSFIVTLCLLECAGGEPTSSRHVKLGEILTINFRGDI